MGYMAASGTGATDLGGIALASSFVWSSRTGAFSLRTVVLGSASASWSGRIHRHRHWPDLDEG